MSFSDSELDRYSRQMILPAVGAPGQRRLKSARVAIIGAGAVGSAALPALAAAGIGRLTIIDGDAIELSNLHRQPIYRTDQIGAAKATTAAAFAAALNPETRVSAVIDRVDQSNADQLLAGQDYVLDGTDNFATRLIVGDCCVRLRTPLLSAAAAQTQVQVALLRGWETGQPCYRCFVGDAFDSDDCDNCSELGVLGPVAAMAGNFAALVLMRSLLGLGPDIAGQLFTMDAVSLVWRSIRLPKDSSCRACGGSASTS